MTYHHKDNAETFSLKPVLKLLFAYKDPDAIYFIGTGLVSSSVSIETKNVLNTDLNTLIDFIIGKKDEIQKYPVVELLFFVLKHGDGYDDTFVCKCETILAELLSHYFVRDKIHEVYRLGGTFAYLPKRKLKLEGFYAKLEKLVLIYLKMSYEKDSE